MDEKLKYRLVGAAVILALAAFFLPLILDSEKYRTKIVSQIPEMPRSNNVTYGDNTGVEDNLEDLQQGTADTPSYDPNDSSSGVSSGSVAEKDTGTLVINLDDDNIEQQIAEQKAADQEKALNDALTAKADETSDAVASEKTAENSVKKAAEDVVKIETATEADKKDPVKSASTEKPKQEAKPEPKTDEPKVAEKVAEKVETKTETKPAVTPDFQDQAWVIQIGSFSNKENATALIEKLRSQGYRAYQRVNDKFSRVFVGPYPDKKSAETRQPELEKAIGSKVQLLKFEPNAH